MRHSLEITKTETLVSRFITEVSGGESKASLWPEPFTQQTPIVLLDGASSTMDISRKLEISRLLERMNREENLTILGALHDVNLAAFFCRRLIFLKDGHIADDGDTDEVLTEINLKEVCRAEALIREVESIGKRQWPFFPDSKAGMRVFPDEYFRLREIATFTQVFYEGLWNEPCE